MSDDSEKTARAEPSAQQFSIIKMYVNDVSFEAPRAHELFASNAVWSPRIDLKINAETRSIGEDMYEALLSLTVTATTEEKTAYLVEIKQGGIFMVRGFDKSTRDQLLGSHCPSTLFPFAREAIAGLVARAGFPQLLLDPINFEALYAQHLVKAKQNAPAPKAFQ